MANLIDLLGYVQAPDGTPLQTRTATLRNNATGLALDSIPTDSNGMWRFDNKDESISYRVDVAMGATSSQVVSRRPWSGEMLSLYVRDELRIASGATVALAGAITVGGALTVAGATTLANTQINGTLGVTGASTLGPTTTGNLSSSGTIAAASTITAGAGLRATTGGLVVSAGGASITGVATFVNGVNVQGSLDVSGDTTTNHIVADGNVLASGNVRAEDHLSVGSATTFTGGEASGFIYIANRGGGASGNPTGGGWIYVEAGTLKYKGSGGTVTTIANA
jgi:hypothetical protein